MGVEGSFLYNEHIIRVDKKTVRAIAQHGVMQRHWRSCKVHWYIRTRSSGGQWLHRSETDVRNYGTVISTDFTVPSEATAVRCHFAILYDVGDGQRQGIPVFFEYNGNPADVPPSNISNPCTPSLTKVGSSNTLRCSWTCSRNDVSGFSLLWQGKYNGSWVKIATKDVPSNTRDSDHTYSGTDYTHLRAGVSATGVDDSWTCDYVFTGAIPNPAYTEAEANKMKAPNAVNLSVSVDEYDSRPTLSWSSSGDLAKKFDIYRVEDNGSWSKRGSVSRSATSSSYKYTDTALAPGKLYSFKVRAINTYNNANTWSDSNEVNNVFGLPVAPTDLSVKVHSADSESGSADFNVTWKHGGAARARSGFELRWGTDNLAYGYTGSASPEADARSHRVSNLAVNTAWTFYIRAKNSKGNSAWSGKETVVAKAKPKKPTCSTAFADGKVTITVSSQDKNASKIVIYRKSPDTSWVAIATLARASQVKYVDGGLASGGKYVYSARAVLPDGVTYSDYADYDDVGGWIEREPSAPTGLTAVATAYSDTTPPTGTVRLSWNNTGSTGDTVEVRYTSNPDVDITGEATDYKTATFNTSTTCEISSLNTALTWRFCLRRKNSAGESDWATTESGSKVVTALVATTPEAPTLVATKASYLVGEEVPLEWVHNNPDGSVQQDAEVQVYVNSGQWITVGSNIGENSWFDYTPDSNTGDTVYWRVRTKGLSSWSPWSEPRTFRTWAPANPSTILHCPDGDLWGISYVKTLDETIVDGKIYYALVSGDYVIVANPIQADIGNYYEQTYQGGGLTTLPLNVLAACDADTTGENGVIEWWCELVSVGGYETTNVDGTPLKVSDGEVTWSKTYKAGESPWIDAYSSSIQFDVSASDMVFTGMYNVRVGCLTAQGLSSEASTVWFACMMVGGVPDPELTATVDTERYSCSLIPVCYSDEEDLPDDVEPEDAPEESGSDDPGEAPSARALAEGVMLSVFRVDQDGSTVPIAENLVNDGSAQCFDAYPNFGTCLYRVVATEVASGAQAFSDLAVKVPAPGVLIQWSGGQVLLPYNLDLSESYDPDVALMEYSGRTDPVSIYGTQLGRTASWKAEVSKADHTEEVAALRKLGTHMADCHVREPSGTGYPAHVKVANITRSNQSVVTTVSLEVTRVEG